MFITRLFSDPVIFFAILISVSLSVCIHEFFHAYVALKCGDSTAADAGHLTLNPLKQMGVVSIIMLLLLGFCWGAVPVDPARLSRGKRIAVALAGPLTNLGLFVLGVLVSVLAAKLPSEPLILFALIFAQFNMVLFCINIAPVPGFDGGTVLMELIGTNKLYSSELGKGFMIGSFLLLFYLVDYIYYWSEFATAYLFKFIGNLIL